MPAPIRQVDEHGFPIPITFDEPTVSSTSPTSRAPGGKARKKFAGWKWLILFVFPALLFGRQLVDLGWDFVANMQFQRAQESFAQGQLDDALMHANRAIQWEPEKMRHWRAYKLRATIYENQNRLSESLEDCNTALQYAPKPDPRLSPNPKQKIALEATEIYIVRAWTLQRLGKSQAALADCTTAIDAWPKHVFRDGSATLLNMRAYISALSGLELKQAADDIAEAIDIRGEIPEFVDTRGCVLLKQGKYKEALADLEMAIQVVENQRRLVPELMNDHDFERSLAVMYHHRSEVYEKLGDNAKAAQDSQRAVVGGYDPARGE